MKSEKRSLPTILSVLRDDVTGR